MKINPDSPDFQRQIDSTATPSQTGKAFGQTLTSKSQANTGPAAQAPSAAQEIAKQDLTNPVQANSAIDRAIQDLMEKEFSGMCVPDREQVGAWLRADPMIRAALLQRITSSAS